MCRETIGITVRRLIKHERLPASTSGQLLRELSLIVPGPEVGWVGVVFVVDADLF